MQLTLVVPGLLDLPASVLASFDAHAPALSRLLASGDRPTSEDDGLVASACRACGIARQDDWPVAPWLARAAGIGCEDGYWLCAEPASLAVGADDVRLDALVDDLGPDDAQALIDLLNAHFSADELSFVAATPARWFVRAPVAQRLATRSPEAAMGEPLYAFLPAGPDAPRWRRWQNEVQMLLFEHPVNRRREHAGRKPVNSLWLWGGGVASQPTSPARVFADERRVRELARASGVALAATPAGFGTMAQHDRASVWLAAIDGDGAGRQLGGIAQAWLRPVERALAARRLSLELVIGGCARTLNFRPQRSSLAQRWLARLSPPRFSQLLLAPTPST